MLAYTEHQHFSKKITRKNHWLLTTRDVHTHITLSQNPTPTHMPQAIRRYSARDFQHSTALFLKLHNQEVITYKVTLSPAAQNKILAHHTHIRLRLPVCRSITWHPRAPSNILPYPTPLPRHPTGYLARDLLYGSTLSSKTSLTPKRKGAIYII